MKAPKLGDVVEAMWVDSEHIALGWVPVSKYVEAAKHPSAYRTAGYWLYGDSKVIAIALSLDPYNGHATHAMAIPRCAVTSIRVIGRSNARVRKAFSG
jgi:hypothetical protein